MNEVVHCKKESYDVYIGRANPRSGLKVSTGTNNVRYATQNQRLTKIYQTPAGGARNGKNGDKQ